MGIWKTPSTIDELRERSRGTMVEHVGIEYLEIGDDFIRARMPVDERTRQPYGILHGGASVVLAETLGSVACRLSLDGGRRGVGIEINANHIRPASSGYVYGTVRPVHTGSSVQVWETTITDGEGRIVCKSRMTLSVIKSN